MILTKTTPQYGRLSNTVWQFCPKRGGVGRPFFVPFQALFGSFSTLFIPTRSSFGRKCSKRNKETRKIRQKWYKVAHQTNCGSMKQSFLSFLFSLQLTLLVKFNILIPLYKKLQHMTSLQKNKLSFLFFVIKSHTLALG